MAVLAMHGRNCAGKAPVQNPFTPTSVSALAACGTRQDLEARLGHTGRYDSQDSQVLAL